MNDKNTHANPNKNRTPRHRAREFALQGLYQWLLNNEPASTVVTNIRSAHGFDKADGTYFTELLHGTIAQSVELREQLDEDRSVAETISPGSDYVEIAGSRRHVMSYLSDFLFSPRQARSPVRALSGGERNRLLLARLFARPANWLIMDEPRSVSAFRRARRSISGTLPRIQPTRSPAQKSLLIDPIVITPPSCA